MWNAMAVVLLLALLGAGCRSSVDPDAPPDIRYGEDACDQCRMLISEPRYAAAYVTRQGEVRRFDDIGDMLLYDAAHGEEVLRFWVHDYATAAWLPAAQAVFVYSRALSTPMAHGIVAFGDPQPARELAARVQGEILSFAELRRRAAAGHLKVEHGPAGSHTHR
ncbi:MAG: hypothetical protein KatS3mg131_2754 [Candidatus Tectimicrobiota bacterium]|nr:MAG: hypothetical protein KatS3mg131_2754 [Candidatus Tectomicrobia bacterium]